MLWLIPALSVATAALIDRRTSTHHQELYPSYNGRNVGATSKRESLSLQPLPYSYSALEPGISAETVRIHHDVHQAAYVHGATNARRALHELDRHQDQPNRAVLRRALTEDLAFQLGGVRLHELYWSSMAPQGGGQPTGALRNLIERDYGSFEAFKTAFRDLVLQLQGSGWVVLTWSVPLQRLALQAIGNHQDNVLHNAIPLLVCDVWEHAYYLDHPADKAAYLDAFFSKVSWANVAQRLAQTAIPC